MCGIFAAVLAKDRLSKSCIQRVLNELSNRGPDGEGMWIADDGRVVLGHRRLSIISPEHGHQPIANEEETVFVTVNGEFYDFESIRRDLQQQGHRFQTESDSEIVVHLYEDHGIDCLRFLRGEFAFVLWDKNRRRLFAARDRFGVKPLCYAELGRGLCLASKAKALFAAGIRPDWDQESFFHALSLQYLLPDRTLFRGVRQVPPGCLLIAEDGDLRIKRYWDMPLDYPTDPPRTTSDKLALVERCRQHVINAVRVRLRADVPVCFQLSGGLDSSGVVGIAAETLERPLDAYAVTFDASAYDETDFAEQSARRSGVRLHRVNVTSTDILENLGDAVRMSEGLCINGHLSAKYLLHQKIRNDGYKVVLTGEGADEAFAGYGHLRIDHWRATGQDTFIESLTSTNRTSVGMMLAHGESLDLSGVRKRLGYVPAWMEAKATFGHRVRSLIHGDVLQEYIDRDPFGELVDSICGGEPISRDEVQQSTRLWSRSALSNYILGTLGDGTEMAHSVEGRVPFLDHQLWHFLREVPLNMRIHGSTEKFILREALRDFVPETVYRRQKHPFDAPPVSLFSDTVNRGSISDMLASDAFRSQPFFDTRRVRERCEQLETADETTQLAWDPVIMTVLSTISLQPMISAAE